MPTIPPRPAGYPAQWVMVFDYFDSLHTGYDTSRTMPFESKEEAEEATRNAYRNLSGGGISVEIAYAYPPVGSQEEPFVVDFTAPSRERG